MGKQAKRLVQLSRTYLIPQNLSAKEKATVTYRNVSWLLTSIFYLTDSSYNSLNYKIIVVLSLLIFTRVILEYYLKSTSRKTIQTTLLLETIALTILLIPTGGLDSPFIWYALNPVFIAANYLRAIYCWLNLTLYLTIASVVTSNLFNRQGLSFAQIIREKSYIILVYVLVTAAMRLLAHLVDYFDRQRSSLQDQRQQLLAMNEKLQEANLRVNNSMEYVLSLYHIIEALSSGTDTRAVLQQLVSSAAKIMDCPGVFLWLVPMKDTPSQLVTENSKFYNQAELEHYLSGPEIVPDEFSYQGVKYTVESVQSSARFYGYLGIEKGSSDIINNEFRNLNLLAFLAEFIAVVLERYELERMSTELIIMEEQNRIANEIHDNVSQRLFSILCGIHALNGNWNKMGSEDITKHLKLIEQSAKHASTELRSSIYRLSTTKRGREIFREKLQGYISDFAYLNNVKVAFALQIDEEKLPSSLKQAVYRIVKEALGNAVRHGKSTEIKVSIAAENMAAQLIISDNGRGFDVANTLKDAGSRGLGINNIQVLTQGLNGSLEINSVLGIGTEITITVPLAQRKGSVRENQGGVA